MPSDDDNHELSRARKVSRVDETLRRSLGKTATAFQALEEWNKNLEHSLEAMRQGTQRLAAMSSTSYLNSIEGYQKFLAETLQPVGFDEFARLNDSFSKIVQRNFAVLNSMSYVANLPSFRSLTAFLATLQSNMPVTGTHFTVDVLWNAASKAETFEEAVREVDEQLVLKASDGELSLISREALLQILLAVLFFLTSMRHGQLSEKRIIQAISEAKCVPAIEDSSTQTIEDAGDFFVATTSVNLRETPSTENPSLGLLHRNQRVRLLEVQGEWYRVEYFDFLDAEMRIGWVAAHYLIKSAGDIRLD